MRNTLTEWERFTGFLKRNGVPVYRVCGELEMEESTLREKVEKVEITLLYEMKIWKLIGCTSEKILNLFYTKRGNDEAEENKPAAEIAG